MKWELLERKKWILHRQRSKGKKTPRRNAMGSKASIPARGCGPLRKISHGARKTRKTLFLTKKLTPLRRRRICGHKMDSFKDCSHLEKEMILSNSNVMMRLQRMLQAQQEFADAISYELRNLRGAQERNHYGDMPEFASKPKTAGKGRPRKNAEPELPQFSRKSTRSTSVLYDE